MIVTKCLLPFKVLVFSSSQGRWAKGVFRLFYKISEKLLNIYWYFWALRFVSDVLCGLFFRRRVGVEFQIPFPRPSSSHLMDLRTYGAVALLDYQCLRFRSLSLWRRFRKGSSAGRYSRGSRRNATIQRESTTEAEGCGVSRLRAGAHRLPVILDRRQPKGLPSSTRIDI